MDFRKELAKELGLGAIAENTMLDDYVKACEAIAIRYHDSEVEKLNIPAVSCPVCDHKNKRDSVYFSDFSYCPDCRNLIRKQTCH